MTQSIIRYLILSLFSYLVGHHVITQQLADQNAASWVNYAVIGLTFVGVVIWSVLEKKYKGILAAYFPKTLGSTSPAAKVLPLALALGLGTCVLISGCAGETGTTPSQAAATVAQNIGTTAVNIASNPFVAQTAGGAAAYALVKYADPSNPAQTAADGDQIVSALMSAANGQALTQTAVQNLATSFKSGSNSAFYATAAQMLSTDFAALGTSLTSQGATAAQLKSAQVSFLTGAQIVFGSLSGSSATTQLLPRETAVCRL